MEPRFTAEYATFVEYIVDYTARIWEGRGIGLIRDMYAPEVAVHTQSGSSHGVDRVISGTLETLHSFPDRQLLPEDVIWSGEAPGDAYSSHRIASTMTHRGFGLFGEAIGRPVLVRTVADCLVRGGRIVEEWLVRDQAAIAMQLGLDPRELGARLAADYAAPPARDAPEFASPEDTMAARAAAAMRAIWNDHDLAGIRRWYAPGAALHLPGGTAVAGHEAMDRFVIGYLAAFPGARLTIEHAIARTDPGRPIRVALRWRLDGAHAGRGAFGPPTGARLSVMGITHSEIVDGLVSREFVLIDELGIWTALGAARG